MYDYYLGGKTNYRSDRVAADKAAQAWPSVPIAARTNRAYMHRVVRMLAERGFRQFLDIGTGIPTSPNLHEVAQSVNASARVVYADNDPIVLAHARALMEGTPEGKTAYIEANVREPESILESEELRATLDLGEPVALSMHALCHFLPDEYDAYGIVEKLVKALPSGSALSLTHVTPEFDPERVQGLAKAYNDAGVPAQVRTKAEVARFFTGLELVEPGLAMVHKWRPEEGASQVAQPSDADVSFWAGVGIKP